MMRRPDPGAAEAEPPGPEIPLCTAQPSRRPAKLRAFVDVGAWAPECLQSVTRALLVSEGAADLSLRQLAILLLAWEYGDGLNVSGHAAELGISRPGVTRAVVMLEELGLIRRHPDPRDLRQTLLRVTSAGSDLVATLAAAMAQDSAKWTEAPATAAGPDEPAASTPEGLQQ